MSFSHPHVLFSIKSWWAWLHSYPLGVIAIAVAVAASVSAAVCWRLVVSLRQMQEVKKDVESQVMALRGSMIEMQERFGQKLGSSAALAPTLQQMQEVKEVQKDVLSHMTTLEQDVERDKAELRGMVDALVAARQQEFESVVHRNTERREALQPIYSQAQEHFSVFATPLRELRDAGSQLLRPATNPTVKEVAHRLVEQFHAMLAPDTELSARLAELSSVPPAGALPIASLRAQLQAGSLAPSEVLRQAFAFAAPAPHDWPDPDAEKDRLQFSPETLISSFLSWVDQVAELRALATQTGENGLGAACTQVIALATRAARNWQVELQDVLIGVARFDERQHELADCIPRADVPPETVVGVVRLGYLRNGQQVRKPKVIVAAAR